MATNERIKKYLDAGSVLGQVTRARAEEIVKELANAGDIQRDQTQEWVDTLLDRGHKTSEQLLDLVRHEVGQQLKKVDGSSLEKMANQVADLLKSAAGAGRSVTTGAADRAAKGAAKGAQAARTAAGNATPESVKQAAKSAANVVKKATPTKKAGPSTPESSS